MDYCLFFFFFLNVHKRGGGGIRTNPMDYCHRNLKEINVFLTTAITSHLITTRIITY
jgi:hypothetical protein